MATLLDTIRNNMADSTQPVGMEDNTQKATSLLRTKLGKDNSNPSDSTNVNLSEAGAVDQTNQQLGKQSQVAAIAGQGMQQEQQAQEQAQQQAEANVAQGRKFNNIQNSIKTNDLLQQAEQNRGKLDLQKNQAAAEQIATGLRLQNRQYTDELQRTGRSNRLDNQADFNNELETSLISSNLGIKKDFLNNQSILAQSDRDFANKVSMIDINQAWNIFNQDRAASKNQQQYADTAGIAKAGIGAYGTYSDSQDRKEYYTKGGGKDTESFEASKARE